MHRTVTKRIKIINKEKSQDSLPIIVVTMATSRQGRSLVKKISESGKFFVRAMTRRPTSKEAKLLGSMTNVEIVKGDLLDFDSLKTSFEDAYGIFGNTTPTKEWGMDLSYEKAQGINLIKAVEKQFEKGKLKHFVFSSICKSSVPNGNNNAPGHFSNKWEIEDVISQRDISKITTILRPSSYFENFLNFLPYTKITETVLPGVVKASSTWQTLSVEDIGEWGYAAFKNPTKFIGVSLNLASEQMNGIEMAEVLQKLRGSRTKVIKYKMIPRILINLIEKDIGVMATWIEQKGYGADIKYLRQLADDFDIKMTSFSSWLKNNDPVYTQLKSKSKLKSYQYHIT